MSSILEAHLLLFFDDTSSAFLKRVKACATVILKETFQVNLVRSRFEFAGYFIPIEFVVFEGTDKLGFFDPHSYRLGINKKIMLTLNDELLNDIIKHELAHLFAKLHYGLDISPHGKEFKSVCERYNIPSGIAKASINLEEAPAIDALNEKLLVRVKKLLSLASSSNEHESELATLKANQILRDYNLSRLSASEKAGPTYLKRVLVAKKRNSKLQAIYDILVTFHVQPVFNQGKGQCALEVCGDKTNVELADYIAAFLDRELEESWKQTKKKNPSLSGALAKNSFYRGLAKGYLEKQNRIDQEMSSDTQTKKKELILLKNDLSFHVSRALPRLSKVSSSVTSEHSASHLHGKQSGANLHIRPGLTDKKSSGKVLLLK